MNMALRSAVAGTCVLALGAGFFGSGDEDIFADCRATTIGEADIGGPFELIRGDTGETVTEADIITGPTLVYFGYTFCPDVCPLDMARNGIATMILEEDEGLMVTPVFITVDPARDDEQVVADFADVFHARAIGLTGSDEQIRAASQAYRTYYRVQPGDPEYYLVDHSNLTYLMFPDIGFVEFYRGDATPEAVADSVACFVEAAG